MLMKHSPATKTALALAAVAIATLLPAQVASAHPLGNFSVNHYSRIELSPVQARIFYVVDLAEIPTFQLKAALDRNNNQRFDADEQQGFIASRVDEIRRQVTFSINGDAIALQTRAPALAIAQGQGGLDTLRLSFWMDAVLPAQSSPLRVAFNDTNDLDRLGWREIVVEAGDGVRISNANASATDVSNELRHYPQDLLNQPLRETSAGFDITLADGAGQVDARAGVAPSPANTVARDNQFASLINYRDLTPSLIAISLLTALGLGALHALEPGHGKSLAAAYLIGTRATPRHAVMLGFTVTVTHTASVFVMGLATLFLSRFIVPEKLFPVLGMMSALIVMVMGASMIANAVRQRRQPRIAADHTHTFDASTNQLIHAHGGKQHTHVPPATLSARNVMAVGVSGGLVPCPAALIVLLSAIALGRIGFGMLLIVAFSIGLAGVLTAISLMLVFSKRALYGTQFARRFAPALAGSRVAQVLPFASGAMIVCAGALLLYYALPFLQLL
jgi:ABC-type nickel/cobalt efflux system permease component RcnA